MAARWARIKFNSDTGYISARNILRPFLEQYLKDGAPKADHRARHRFRNRHQRWRRLHRWPAGCCELGARSQADAALSAAPV